MGSCWCQVGAGGCGCTAARVCVIGPWDVNDEDGRMGGGPACTRTCLPGDCHPRCVTESHVEGPTSGPQAPTGEHGVVCTSIGHNCGWLATVPITSPSADQHMRGAKPFHNKTQRVLMAAQRRQGLVDNCGGELGKMSKVWWCATCGLAPTQGPTCAGFSVRISQHALLPVQRGDRMCNLPGTTTRG